MASCTIEKVAIDKVAKFYEVQNLYTAYCVSRMPFIWDFENYNYPKIFCQTIDKKYTILPLYFSFRICE